ncbi:MAG: hypothetical protein AAGI53_17145 [Planctomycetota bacterium]
MAKKPTHRGNASSLSGRPKAFAHVKSVRPEFGMAASGEREKASIRARAPNFGKAFDKAHEGPREELGEPRKHHIYTLHGKVAAAVYSKVDREKLARNRQKDLQMKKWRERKAPQPMRTNRPKHLLKKQSPEVFADATKKRSFEQILQAKKARGRDHGRGGRA